MIEFTAPFRRATRDDAAALAELINLAGEGLPLYIWGKMAEPGESPRAVGQNRARREEGSFSYRNAIVAEAANDGADATVAACLIGYSLPRAPKPIDRDNIPAMFVPLQELENLAPGTWYLNAIAAFPQFRGCGYGTGLLVLAERIAIDAGCSGLSLIVANTNEGARRLYERCGYRQIATRPLIKEGWQTDATEWVLLLKRF